jgi:hypothetical protein
MRDVRGDLEEAVRGAALGVHAAFGHPLAVEVLHLLNHGGVRQHHPDAVVVRCSAMEPNATVKLRGRRKRFANA